MIPALIAPALVLPAHRPDTRAQWSAYTGALNGEWIDVTTYGGPAGGFASITDGSFNAALNRGFVKNGSRIQLFRMDGTLVPARLGDRLAHSHGDRGEFTGDSQRIWLATADAGEIKFEFAEYDAGGLTQLGGSLSDSLGSFDLVAPAVLITDLDATRAIVSGSLEPPGTNDPQEMRVGILQRSGGTILATLNSVAFGASGFVSVGHGVRPLRSDRSVVVFPANAAAPWTLDVQGVAHAGTTPSATGSASTLTANGSGALGAAYARISRCVDGLGASVGRFLVAWPDDTSGNIHLRMVQYDGTTLTLGTELDSGIDVATASREFDLEDLGDGVAVILLRRDPTASGEGFAIVEYHPNDVDQLGLAMSSLGLQNLAKDGLLADETLANTARVLPISRNRFAVAVAAVDFESVFLKVVHNGSDAIT